MSEFKARRIAAGVYVYRGWDVERMECGHWNLKPASEECWSDGAESLRDAKAMIDSFKD